MASKVPYQAPRPTTLLYMLMLTVTLYQGREHAYKSVINKREHEHEHKRTKQRNRRKRGGRHDFIENSDDFNRRHLAKIQCLPTWRK